MNIETGPRRSAGTPSRRTLVKGITWATPVITTSVAAPAIAVSGNYQTDHGLFVSAARTSGEIGYQAGNDSGGGPTTSDLNWNQDSGTPSNCSLYTNGEGSFTPHSNSLSGIEGAHTSSSGFWWATPKNDGRHINGSTATLEANATFTTRVTITFPASTDAQWALDHIYINNRRSPANFKTGTNWWHPENNRTGGQTLTDTINRAGSHPLLYQTVAGRFTFDRPEHVKTGGSLTFTGELRFTTNSPVTISDNGAKHYGQALIMPASLGFYDQYGWTRFELTSWVQNARITYTAPDGTDIPDTVLGPHSLEQTTFIVPCRRN